MPWSWHWHTHPEVWVLVGVLFVGYRLALRNLGPLCVAPGEEVSTKAQRRWFTLGILTLFIGSEWPIHDLAEGYLYSVHMVQHMLFTLAAPAFFLMGTPAWLARALLPGKAMKVARALTRPIVALTIFNLVLVFTHWPLIVSTSVNNEAFHFFQHTLIFTSALIMWTPVLSPLIELPRLSYPGQMMYLFLQSLVPTVPASFLTFGDRPLYPIYETFPRVAGISALADQRAAGLIMKIVGGGILWIVITAVFFRWSRMERDSGVDAFALNEIDRTLNRMELKR